MPSSANRRRIELPNELHERLRVRAERAGMTVAALAAALLTDALARDGEGSELACASLGWREAASLAAPGRQVLLPLLRELLEVDGEQLRELRAIGRRLDALAGALEARPVALAVAADELNPAQLRRLARLELGGQPRGSRPAHPARPPEPR